MFRILGQLLVVLAFGWTGSASASLLAPVTVNGREWLQPVDFYPYSWNTINSVCDASTGECNGSLGGNDMTGWTWAGIEDLNALFNYYIGAQVMGPGPSNYAGVPSFPLVEDMLADGWMLTYDEGTNGARYIAGWSRTELAELNSAFDPRIGSNPTLDIAFISAAWEFKTVSASFGGGAWFSRDAASVPAPATLILVGLGVFGLCFFSRLLPIKAG